MRIHYIIWYKERIEETAQYSMRREKICWRERERILAQASMVNSLEKPFLYTRFFFYYDDSDMRVERHATWTLTPFARDPTRHGIARMIERIRSQCADYFLLCSEFASNERVCICVKMLACMRARWRWDINSEKGDRTNGKKYDYDKPSHDDHRSIGGQSMSAEETCSLCFFLLLFLILFVNSQSFKSISWYAAHLESANDYSDVCVIIETWNRPIAVSAFIASPSKQPSWCVQWSWLLVFGLFFFIS